MARSPLSPSTAAYMQKKLACIAARRLHPPSSELIARLLAEMESPDERVRAQAVRQVCPCHVPWEVFYQLRPVAKRLQQDPSPLVRANALHIEEDAREIAALEALQEWHEEWEPLKQSLGSPHHKSPKRGH